MPTAGEPSRIDSEVVQVTRSEAVATVQLNRPDVMNAMSTELMVELHAALDRLDRDLGVRAIVIAGHDRAFAAGADLKAMRDRDLETAITQDASRFWSWLASVETPLIAAVSGYAFGGGCELALACDMIVASETALFSQAEVLVGIVPGGGGSQRLARTIGKQRAMEMVLTGCRVTAAQARAYGFVNRVVGVDRWRQEADELAALVASGAPLAVRFGKRSVLAAEEAPLGIGMSLDRRLYELSMATEDRVEGMSAFVDRRAPVWRGR
jgi:enoyl-CoA hydratase/carnithine racemase